MTDRLEIAAARVALLETALSSVLRVLDSIGGYLPSPHQIALREARALMADGERLAQGTGTHKVRGVAGVL